ncbi:uncharacterized protein LOC113789108 [Dermatophagoides pteronyssinus]|uniref:uncharacterized protein LOC113789108 n=1 Tax=Dermatophagoides pteronyssinus TaxID=6956 RepID=UPI003F6662EC
MSKMVKFHPIFIAIISIMMMKTVYGQYPGYRPNYSSMAFSPYHPARINHETLPISQAEFAQLVAESMATSHGPHHHHPPNTDQDYEGPDHWRKESDNNPHNGAEMMRDEHHHHHHHHQHPLSSNPVASHQESPMYQQQSTNHYNRLETGTIRSSVPSMQRPQSQYQPEEQGPGEIIGSGSHLDEYPHRAPVFETDYTPDPESMRHSSLKESDIDDNEPQTHVYGGRPNSGPAESYHPHHHLGNIPRYHMVGVSNDPREQDEYRPSGNQESEEQSPVGQPVYGPSDPPPLAYHQDFSRQYHHAHQVPRHPHPHPHSHHYHHPHHPHRPSFYHHGPMHAMHSHPHPRMMMSVRRPSPHFNPQRHHHPMQPIDHYMAADSSTNNAIAMVSPTIIADTMTSTLKTSQTSAQINSK